MREREIKVNITKGIFNELINLNIWDNELSYKNDYVSNKNSKLRVNNDGLFNFKYRLDSTTRVELEHWDLDYIEDKIMKERDQIIPMSFGNLKKRLMNNKIDKSIITNRFVLKTESYLVTVDNFSDNYNSLYEVEFELLDDTQILHIVNIKKEIPKSILRLIDFNKMDNRDKYTKLKGGK